MNKKEFTVKPEKVTENWPDEFTVESWRNVIISIPSPLFVTTGWKSNGKENACLSAGAAFFGGEGEFICIFGSVYKHQHMYKSLRETKCCVLNFPSADISQECFRTIENNGFETDEITASGLTAEKASGVNAPRIAECFLNIECEYLWEHELFPGSSTVTIAVKGVRFCMDSDHYEQKKLGRYGKTGYLYHITPARNPDTGETEAKGFGRIELLEDHI